MDKTTLQSTLEEKNALVARMEAEAANIDAQMTQLQNVFNVLQTKYNQTLGQRDLLQQMLADEEASEHKESEETKED